MNSDQCNMCWLLFPYDQKRAPPNLLFERLPTLRDFKLLLRSRWDLRSPEILRDM